MNDKVDPLRPTLAYTTFMQVFNNLKRECRLVDDHEKYTPMGYIENTFWRLFLGVSYAIGKNR